MKKQVAAVCAAALLLGGCATHEAVPATQPSETVELPILGAPGESVAAVVLGDIWAQYEPQERFAVYGGMMSRPVPDAPGDFDMEHPEAWVMQYRFPVGCLQMAQQGASITHLLNENLFTAAVIRVSDSTALSVLTSDWRYELQHSDWQSVRPDRMLLAQVAERYLVMAMGSKAYIRTFREKLKQAYPYARITYEEPITN